MSKSRPTKIRIIRPYTILDATTVHDT